MSETAAAGSSKLTLSYSEGRPYSVAKIRPGATDESLLKMARSLSVFQEGDLRDVFNYVETEIGEG